MAEPTNTPMPASTPVAGMTPHSMSPVLATTGGDEVSGIAALTINGNGHSPSHSRHHKTKRSGDQSGKEGTKKKPIVLHIGDPVRYNPDTYATFTELFDVVCPSLAERQRPAFAQALMERRWGDFSAVFRPFWGTGGEMGRWDAELIALLPDSCRVFASAGAGFDWADTRALGEKGVIYCNSGLAAAEAVADFAVAMVLSTFRHLPWCIGAATTSQSSHSRPLHTTAIPTTPQPPKAETELPPFARCHNQATAVSHNLRGHVLGLVGLGNIGQQLATKLGCPAFGMRVHYHDVERKSADVEARLGAIFHPTLASLLGTSDCVVLCAPPAADGHALLDREALTALKRGARVVNVARGSLVDEEALADALEAGTVSAAALDVHTEEPRVNPRLLAMANGGSGGSGEGLGHPGRVMLTCHNAGGTVETHVGFEELSMRNIIALLGGGNAITPVNLHYLRK